MLLRLPEFHTKVEHHPHYGNFAYRKYQHFSKYFTILSPKPALPSLQTFAFKEVTSVPAFLLNCTRYCWAAAKAITPP
jgi:hypothetical protein